MQFKSDFSKFNFIILLIPVILVLIISILSEDDINLIVFPPLAILGLLAIFFTVLFFTTYYEIQKEDLIISMFFYKVKIKISDIRAIKYSNSFIKTNLYKPGFHYNGIEIFYNKFDDIYISPENKEKFIQILLEHNPNIEIKK